MPEPPDPNAHRLHKVTEERIVVVEKEGGLTRETTTYRQVREYLKEEREQMPTWATVAIAATGAVVAAALSILAVYLIPGKGEAVTIFAFGAFFVVALLVLAIAFPHPTQFQYTVFRIVLALAAAGVGALIPGLLEVKVFGASKEIVSASGAAAVFVIVYFFSPASLVRS